MELDELKQYAKAIFNLHPDEEIYSMRELLNITARNDIASLHAARLVADKMAQYIDELLVDTNDTKD